MTRDEALAILDGDMAVFSRDPWLRLEAYRVITGGGGGETAAHDAGSPAASTEEETKKPE